MTYRRIFERKKKKVTFLGLWRFNGHINYGHANVVVTTRFKMGFIIAYETFSLNEYLCERGEYDWSEWRKSCPTCRGVFLAIHLLFLDAAEVKVENVRERTNKILTSTFLSTDAKSTGEYNNDHTPLLSYFSYKFFF